jgi:dihydrofolate reductase
MRKLILKMSVSVDGFVGGPKGELDWIFRNRDDAAARWSVDTLRQAGLHLMGSRTYYDMAAWWPTSTEIFAPVMNEIPKAVATTRSAEELFSTRDTTQAVKDAARARTTPAATPTAEVARSWSEPTVLTGDLVAAITRLKQQPGKDIYAHGGAGFARSLVRLGLVDEFCLLVIPVAIGSGLSFFTGLSGPLDFELIDSISFPKGSIARTYRPKSE